MDKLSLETFLTVAREHSFSRAAEKLFITQPAASKRIQALEESLNTRLFDRIGKNVQLTTGGQLFYQHAEKLLLAMNDCKTAIQNLDLQVEGDLRIGVSHHIGLHRLPPYLKQFSHEYPGVQLQISFVDSEKAYQLVHKGELEIALATLSPWPQSNIKEVAIWDDPLTFVVSGDHFLTGINAKRPLNLADLSGQPAILPGQQTYTGKIIVEMFSGVQKNINYLIQTNYLETIRMMVSIGMGWSVLPRTMLNKDLRGLHVDAPQPRRTLGLIHHEARTLSNAAKAMISILRRNKSGY